MPVEVLQCHVGRVGHRDVIPHLAARQHLGIAPLGDGHAQIRGLVVIGQLDDLAGILRSDERRR